jgi:hypothetical protein
MAEPIKVWDKAEGEKYTDIREVIEDCAGGKPVYLRGFVTSPDVVMKATVTAVLDWVTRGQLSRCELLF